MVNKHTNAGLLSILFILVVFSCCYVTIYSRYNMVVYLNDYQSIIQLNHLIECLLIVIIIFFIYNTFFRNNNIFGVKITKKLFILLSSVIAIPSLINIQIANYFIENTINRLFSPQIEELFNNSFRITEETIRYVSDELKYKGVLLSNFLQLTNKDIASVRLYKARNILGLTALSIYTINGELLSRNADKNSSSQDLTLHASTLTSIKKHGFYYRIIRNDNGDYIFSYYKIYQNKYILAMLEIAPEFIRIDNNTLLQNKELYFGLLSNRDHLKSIYSSTLIISILLALSIAVLLSIIISQFLIKRIENLIQNIELVRDGGFRKTNLFFGNDELSQLIILFDDMGHKLETVRKSELLQKEEITTYKNYLENLINSLSSGVLVYDKYGNIKNMNLASFSLLGVDKSLISVTLSQWHSFHPHVESLMDIILTHLHSDVHDWESNMLLKTTNNVKHIFVKTLQFNTTTETLYMTIINDVTNLVKAKKNQAWADIAKRLAHEIKNPLTPIVLSAERIEMKLTPKLTPDDQAFVKRLVHQIIIQVDDLRDLVNKFRDFANISKPNPVHLEMVSFLRLFLVLYEEIQYIEFDTLIPEANIMGDAALLRQVFHNLLKNAIESLDVLEQDNATKSIKITLKIEEHWLNILIKDNGRGFDRVILDNLFEPYGTTKGAKGSGLGMAIVKKIIDEHAGVIEVFNHTGANIVVKFPIVR